VAAQGTFSGEIRLVDDVAATFATLVAQLVAEVAPTSIALSGGSTAEACYAALATRTDVDWSDVEVYFGDERFVPVSDPDSNEGMARRVLLDVAAPRAVHSLATAGATVDDAATAYDARVRAAATIGLVHLGLGPDGHTASLFPGSPNLQETQRLVVANSDTLHPHPRLTFTYPAIARAPLVVFTVAGEEKRDAFTRVRAGDDLPATHVRAADGGRVVWLVDRAAAGD
jgi:6-phosphogluconolactonase